MINQEAREMERYLVEQIRSGDASVWQQFIDRYEGRLLAFARSRVMDKTEAEDIVQDAFIGFLNSLPNFDCDRSLESYLFSIVSYKVADYFRKNSRVRTMASLVGQGGSDEIPIPPLIGASRAVSSIARSVEQKRSEEELMASTIEMQIAKWRERGDWKKLKCLELVFVIGESNKSVADRLGLSEQQVANFKSDFLERTRSLVSRA